MAYNRQQTLKVYEKKTGNKYFFIRKALQPLFSNLNEFTIICGSKRYSNRKITLKNNGGNNVSYFIFAHEVFDDYDIIKKNDEVIFKIKGQCVILVGTIKYFE